MQDQEDNPGAPALIGFRFAPLAVLVLVAGMATCWKLMDSGALGESVALRGQPTAYLAEAPGEARSREDRGKEKTLAEEPAVPPPSVQSEPRSETPVAASIAPSAAPMVTLSGDPAAGSAEETLAVTDIAEIAAEDDAVRVESVGRSGVAVTESGSISSVDELLEAANRVVAAAAIESVAEPERAEKEAPNDDTAASVRTKSGLPQKEEFEVVVISPDEVLRLPAEASVKVRKTNHESIVENWNTMTRQMSDAVDSGAVDRVRELIETGENVNGSDIQGLTPLMKAAWNSDANMVDALLELGADLNLASNNGRTALYTGVVSGNTEVVRLLLESGAPTNAPTDSGKTPLMASAWSDYPEIALMLLRYGADPNRLDDRGRGALFYALWDRNEYVARLLAANGADTDTTDYLGQSAADIARLRRIQLGERPAAGTSLN